MNDDLIKYRKACRSTNAICHEALRKIGIEPTPSEIVKLLSGGPFSDVQILAISIEDGATYDV